MVKVIFKNNSNLIINEWLIKVYQRDFLSGKAIADCMRVPMALKPNETQTVELDEKHIFARYTRITYYTDDFGDMRKKTRLRRGWKNSLEGKFPVVKFINQGSKSLGISDDTEIVAHNIPADIIIEKVISPSSEWAQYSTIVIETEQRNINRKFDEPHYIRQAVITQKKLRPKKELDILKKLQKKASELRASAIPLRIQSAQKFVSPKLEI